jgi:hypothetical protein
MDRYFKRQGSEVIEKISDSRTASPNLWWTPEQMTIHGFTECKADPVAVQKEKDEADAEALIQAKMRDLAVASLKSEGKLDQAGKIAKVK